jgi:pimeloyl-ACP methyl ester carboxylesterase
MRLPLILIPGLLCDAVLWRPITDGLAEEAAAVVADVTLDDSVAAMARRILDWAPARFALAGLSMGGYVAQELMRQAPERVTRLALLDTSARPDTPEQSRRRKGLIALARQGRFKGVTPRLLPMLVHPDRLEDAPLVDTVMGMAERVGRAAFLRQQTAILGRPDGVPDLSGIDCPTLVLCGRQDVLTPPDAHEEMAFHIPGATLVQVEACGHLSPLERPEPVLAAMRTWLAAPA